MPKIVIASGNEGKIKEINRIFASDCRINVKNSITLLSQTQLQIPEAIETGLTFVENAILKARNACSYANMPAISDDSGLEVDALASSPGVFSARYAGPKATWSDNISKLLQELRGVPKPQRTARFQCVLVFLRFAEDPMPIICHGTWEGEIDFVPSGTNGFGYDPVFWVPTHNCMAAQLSTEIKNSISHRAQALHKLKQLLVYHEMAAS